MAKIGATCPDRHSSVPERCSGCAEDDIVMLRERLGSARIALGQIASLAGSTAIDFGGSHDEQRAAIFNACRDALAGKVIRADDYPHPARNGAAPLAS